MNLKTHEYADVFPLLGDDDLRSLADDIKAHGQNEPIVTYQGKILDGRNRHAACQIAGVEPITKPFDGKDPVSFVLSQNLHRRHLTIGQRAMIAERVATMRHGGQERLSKSSKDNLDQPDRKTRQQAARELDVSGATLDRARVVDRQGIPELVKAVETGEMSVGGAALIAKLPKEEQANAIQNPTKPVMNTATQPQTLPLPSAPRTPLSRGAKLSRLAHKAANILRNITIPGRDKDLRNVKSIIQEIEKI